MQTLSCCRSLHCSHLRILKSQAMDKAHKRCPKCGVLIKSSGNFHRHVKRCGTTVHRTQCPFCTKSYSRNDDLKKHLKQKHSQAVTTPSPPPPGFTCDKCGKKFSYEMAFNVHQKSCCIEKPKPFQCTTCGKYFTRKATLEDHEKHIHQVGGGVKRKASEEEGQQAKKPKLPENVSDIPPADKQVSALKGAKVDAFFKPKTESQRTDQQVFFKETLPRLQAHLQKVLSEKKGIKWNLMYHCTLSMEDEYQTEPRIHNGYFRTPHPIISLYPQQLSEQLPMTMEAVEERMATFMQAGSGWTLQENHALVLEMVDYTPIGGSTYIELPKDVYDTKSIVNVKNEDQACFKWAVLSALHPAEHHAERLSHYQPYSEELNLNGIEFPVTVDEIGKFEKLNPEISVTILGYEKPEKKEEKSGLFPLRVPDQQQENHVVLLYWSKGDVYHYAWVKNLNRLLSHTKTVRNQSYFCERCFQGFIRPDLLGKHLDICRSIPIQAVQMV